MLETLYFAFFCLGIVAIIAWGFFKDDMRRFEQATEKKGFRPRGWRPAKGDDPGRGHGGGHNDDRDQDMPHRDQAVPPDRTGGDGAAGGRH